MMPRLLVVSDTSPVSALVAMGWLDSLPERWDVVHVPEMVWNHWHPIGPIFKSC
jgi:hypothetical protein